MKKHNVKTAPRFAGIGGHHSAKSGTVEWLTPPETIKELGGWQSFDLDPCTPIEQPYPTARSRYTMFDDGLLMPWDGRVWMNPPYDDGVIEHWLSKLALHGRGTALIFARTETRAFFRHVWNGATALLFMEGRINFHIGEGYSVVKTRKTYLAGDKAPGNAGAPTVLCAYGTDDADILAACKIAGRFVPLRIPRSVFFRFVDLTQEPETEAPRTWSAALREFFADRPGPVGLDDLYRHFAAHPKAAANRNFDAKLRQQLQRGPYRRVARGKWEATANG
jgi:hypothetical protein